MKTYYLSFDDTDTKDSIGTGHVLEGFLTEAGIDFDYISRHQLYVHEEIPYTSHNSSMCAKIWTGRSETDLVAAAAAYLKTHAPLGSDPGLGVLALPLTGPAIELVLWGKAAKKSVLQKADAYALSQRCGVHLSEHGGDGQGVVGALAAMVSALPATMVGFGGSAMWTLGRGPSRSCWKRQALRRCLALGKEGFRMRRR